jgi:hypothetical protein
MYTALLGCLTTPGLDGMRFALFLFNLSVSRPTFATQVLERPRLAHLHSPPRVSTASPRSTISTRPRLRGSRLTASPHVLLSRPAPATFKHGSSTRECFRSSSERLPRRHWPNGTTLIPARRTGGGLDGPALPIANRNTESQMASSLSCACTATGDNSTRWRTASSKR